MIINKINITEFVEAKIWERGFLKDVLFFEGNTVTATGKTELAQLVGGIDSKTIDRMWAYVGGMQSKNVDNTRSDNTLEVACSSAYTITGNYTGIFTGNNALGSGSYFNSIALDITLSAGSEIEFTVKWVFTGDAGAGAYGNEICASRLGKIGDVYDAYLHTIATYDTGALVEKHTIGTSVSNNTLTIDHNDAFNGPQTFDAVHYITDETAVQRHFDKFNGFTINVGSGQEIFFNAEFVFG